MLNFRNYFKSIFSGGDDKSGKSFQSMRMFNSFRSSLLSWGKNKYDINIIRACVHAIASHTAKLSPKVVFEGTPSKRLKNLGFLLSQKPNEYMNSYDFLYKTISMLECSSNAFIFVRYVDDIIEGFYPISYSQVEFLECENEIYCKFRFRNNGFELIVPYEELIHLRKYYNQHELFGSGSDVAIAPVLEVVKAANESMINAVKSTGQLRGIIKYSGNIKEESLEKKKKEFVDSYMSLSGDGIGSLDSKAEFIPTKIDPLVIDSRQQKLIYEHVCMHFGVSEAILRGNYKEDEYNAFYNSVVEPLAILLSLELTNKIFTKEEISKGYKILLSADKMTFANNATKSQMCRDMVQLGIFSINECRKIFELESIPDGDRHIVSLNYVDLSKANEYQGVGGMKDET